MDKFTPGGYKKALCPIGRKDPERRHKHDVPEKGGIIYHEETIDGNAWVRMMIERREFPKKGIAITDAIIYTVSGFGTPMPNSYHRKHGFLSFSQNKEFIKKVNKRIAKLLRESRMQTKLK